MISSPANEKVKHVCALNKKAALREEEGVFVAEGVRLFEEIPPGDIKEAYFTEEGLRVLKERGHSDPEQLLRDGRAEEVSLPVMEKMSDVVTPQGVLAVVKRRKHDWEELLPEGKAPLLILLEDIQDPGNLGTVLRTAEAAGAHGVILAGNTADIYSPKVVRSTMGAIFRLPFMRLSDLSFCFGTLRSRGVKIHAAAMEGAEVFSGRDYLGPTAFVIGNEGKGLKKETIDGADDSVFIPMAGKTESLNASVSAALLLYEAARQRGYQK
ncbi:MAG: RNA methyltransferase [Lachnospiraceae bacterium]|nr:RNA methyltransferase [Lachnospiraceae bacterium]